jgi:hypothetical protein
VRSFRAKVDFSHLSNTGNFVALSMHGPGRRRSGGSGRQSQAARSDTLGSNVGAPRLRGRLSQMLSSRVVLAVTGLSV